jgi:hypothetical protein
MSRIAVIVCAGLLAWNAPAQTSLPDAFHSEINRARSIGSRVSSTGQFICHDSTEILWPKFTLDPASESNFAHVDAALLAVSCEHIKAALLRELQAPDHWRGNISFFLHHARSLDEPVVIAPTVNSREWTYYVSLPDIIDRGRLVSAVVGVVLLEIANREATDHTAEVPVWLTQGLTRQLMAKDTFGLVVDQPKKSENGILVTRFYFDGVKDDPLKQTHDVLQSHAPLTLAQLSWPEPGFEETDAYRASAQLFVRELLQYPDGPRSLRTMVQKLPQHFNWQLSFLEAFSGRFGSELDVDKWWMLTVIDFTGRDLSHTWAPDESWRKLDEIIRTSAQVRSTGDELPLHTEVSLQSIIRYWNYPLQAGVLKNKIAQLGLLRASVSQDLVNLTDQYRQVLQTYVKKREKSGLFHRLAALNLLGSDTAAADAIRQLDTLDAWLADSKPAPAPTKEVTASLPSGR